MPAMPLRSSDFRGFRQEFARAYGDPYAWFFARNQHLVSVKSEELAARNLRRIMQSALRISNRHGFAAMTLRMLSRHTRLSIGTLYAHIESKDTLLAMILDHVHAVVTEVLARPPDDLSEPVERLRWTLRTHVFLTEVMQPWFHFAYMEAKSFHRQARQVATNEELYTERLIADRLREVSAHGTVVVPDPLMTAALIKPLLQDWYLKRWKYRRRQVTPDAYAAWVIALVEAFLASGGPAGHALERLTSSDAAD
jgi:TetR/AcrR family transcriptional regulator, cholesterol catabolism regulator